MVDHIKGKLKRWSTLGGSSPFDYTTMTSEDGKKEKRQRDVEIEMRSSARKSTEQKDKENEGKENETLNAHSFDNSYTNKKTIAKGLLDFGLLMANASQLKTLLILGSDEEFYDVNLTLLCMSLILQLIVGVFLLLLASQKTNTGYMNKLNNMTVILVLLITVINVFVAALGIKHSKNSRNSATESNGNRTGITSTS